MVDTDDGDVDSSDEARLSAVCEDQRQIPQITIERDPNNLWMSWNNAREAYDDRIRAFQHQKIRQYFTLREALEAKNNVTRTQQAVFATDRPRKPRVGDITINYSKSYLVGDVASFFRAFYSIDQPIVADEVVYAPPGVPLPIYFDVEIKRCGTSRWDHRDKIDPKYLGNVKSILRSLIDGLGFNIDDVDERVLEALAAQYAMLSNMEWTEEDCTAGLRVICEHISNRLEMMLGSRIGVDGGDIPINSCKKMHVCSGCREDKLSFHIIMDDIYCDHQCLSMPLVVHDIKGWFLKDNVEWLLSNPPLSAEKRFRIRALMLNEQLISSTDGVFAGGGGTPFDEAVYSHGHLIRCVMASKVRSPHLSMLPLKPTEYWHPLYTGNNSTAENTGVGVTGVMVTRSRVAFSQVFDSDQNHLYEWRKYNISCRVLDGGFDRVILISKLSPKNWKYFHSNATWYGNRRRYAGEVYDVNFSSLAYVASVITTLYAGVDDNDGHYEETRRVNVVTREGGVEYDEEAGSSLLCHPHEKVVIEDGSVRRLYQLNHGQKFFCGKKTENNPSATFRCGGYGFSYTCFCQHCRGATYYSVPPENRLEYMERRFPYRDSETIISDDASAKFRNFDPNQIYVNAKHEKERKVLLNVCSKENREKLNWRKVVKKAMRTFEEKGTKFHVIDAPCETGKTFEMQKLCASVVGQGGRYCFVVHRKSLADDIYSSSYKELQLEHYKRSKISLRHNREPDGKLKGNFVICYNSLYKFGEGRADVVILDEVGALRRHIVGKTTRSVLPATQKRFVRLIKEASLVVMLQHHISLADVEMITSYAGVDPTDRNRVEALRVIKPHEMHRLTVTYNHSLAMNLLLQKYCSSFDDEESDDDDDEERHDVREVGISCVADDISALTPSTMTNSVGETNLAGSKHEEKLAEPENACLTNVTDTTAEVTCSTEPDVSTARRNGNNHFVTQVATSNTTEVTCSADPHGICTERQNGDLFVNQVGTPTDPAVIPGDADAVVGGYQTCHFPFVVFCTQKRAATYIAERLKQKAVEIGADPGRVKLVTSSLKDTDKWNVAFFESPNERAADCDVLVATSVIGVGISLNNHFGSFFGFLYNGILTVMDEWQFIHRCRFGAKISESYSCRESRRKSFLWIEKGHGLGSGVDIQKSMDEGSSLHHELCRDLNGPKAVEGVVELHRSTHFENLNRAYWTDYAEKQRDSSQKDKLWEKLLRDSLKEKRYEILSDEADERKMGVSEELLQIEARKYSSWRSKYTSRLTRLLRIENSVVTDLLAAEEGCDEADVLAHLSWDDVLPLAMKLQAAECCLEWSNAFPGGVEFVSAVIKRKLEAPFLQRSPDLSTSARTSISVKLKNHLSGKSWRNKYARCSYNLCIWIGYFYTSLCENPEGFLGEGLSSGRFNLHKHLGGQAVLSLVRMRVCGTLLPILFTSSPSELPYIVNEARSPFYIGLRVKQHESLCVFFKKIIGHEGDDDSGCDIGCVSGVVMKKRELRRSVNLVLQHHRGGLRLEKIFACMKSAHQFVQHLCKLIGFELKTNGRSVRENGHKIQICENLMTPYDLVLAFASPPMFRCMFIDLLPTLFTRGNVPNEGLALIREAVKIHNDVMDEAADTKRSRIVIPQNEIIITNTIPQRLHENMLEKTEGFDPVLTLKDDDYIREDRMRKRAAAAYRRADANEKMTADSSEIRGMCNVYPNLGLDESDTCSLACDDSQPYVTNRFVDEEAYDDDGEDYTISSPRVLFGSSEDDQYGFDCVDDDEARTIKRTVNTRSSGHSPRKKKNKIGTSMVPERCLDDVSTSSTTSPTVPISNNNEDSNKRDNIITSTGVSPRKKKGRQDGAYELSGGGIAGLSSGGIGGKKPNVTASGGCEDVCSRNGQELTSVTEKTNKPVMCESSNGETTDLSSKSVDREGDIASEARREKLSREPTVSDKSQDDKSENLVGYSGKPNICRACKNRPGYRCAVCSRGIKREIYSIAVVKASTTPTKRTPSNWNMAIAVDAMNIVENAIHGKGDCNDILATAYRRFRNTRTPCTVNRGSMGRLKSGVGIDNTSKVLLNDEIINFFIGVYLSQVDQHLCRKDKDRRPSYFFSSYFLQKLLDECNRDRQYHGYYNFDAVGTWGRQMDILDMQYLFFPVNDGNVHWFLACVCMEAQEIWYLDSMCSQSSEIGRKDKKRLLSIAQYIDDMYKKKKGQHIDWSKWKIVHCNTPMQKNGHDCGVYVCLFSFFIINGWDDFCFNREDVDSFRKFIALAILSASEEHKNDLELPMPKINPDDTNEQMSDNYAYKDAKGTREPMRKGKIQAKLSFQVQLPPDKSKEKAATKVRRMHRTSSPLHGIRNLGSTCYMSVSLHTLFSIPQFLCMLCSSYREISRRRDLPLTKALLEVANTLGALEETLEDGDAPLFSPVTARVADPRAFKIQIDDLTKLFCGNGLQHDAAEFIVHLIDLLHEELSDKKQGSQDDIAAANDIIDNDVTNVGTTTALPVDEYFHIKIEFSINCNTCDYSRSTEELYRHLPVVVDGYNGQPPCVQRSLERFCQPCVLEDFKCEKCCCKDTNERTTATQRMQIISRPKAILLHFKRYNGIKCGEQWTYQKNKAELLLPQSISIDPICSENANSNGFYNLQSVVHHIGDTANSGHYTSCVKRKLGDDSEQWVCFDDSVGRIASFDDVTNDEDNKQNCYLALYLNEKVSYRAMCTDNLDL